MLGSMGVLAAPGGANASTTTRARATPVLSRRKAAMERWSGFVFDSNLEVSSQYAPRSYRLRFTRHGANRKSALVIVASETPASRIVCPRPDRLRGRSAGS